MKSNIELTDRLRMILLEIVFGGDEWVWIDDIGLTKTEREKLKQAGLIDVERRAREGKSRPVYHVRASDRAWTWAQANFDTPLGNRVVPRRLYANLAGRLRAYLKSREVNLVEFLTPQPTTKASPSRDSANDVTSPPTDLDDVRAQIRRAYLSLSNGSMVKRVRLSDLRTQIGKAITEPTLKRALESMQRDDEVTLSTFDDPRDRTEADTRAALTIHGDVKHVLYLRR